MTNDVVRIGSRGSELALWQAHWVERELRAAHPRLQLPVEIIRTTGDKIQDSPLSKIGDKGLFTREIESALLEGRIDLAVHSLKDLPTELPEGLVIGAICKREDVRDVFIPHPRTTRKALLDQPQGAKIATGSLRRTCQLLHLRKDIEVVDLRGNLNTRLRKLDESDWAGMILARAGVVRLGWESRIGETIPATVLLPAVGQGALAVEVREGDERVDAVIAGLRHSQTAQAALAERALLRRLEGGCQVPIGTYGRIETDENGVDVLRLDALVGSLEGTTVVKGKCHGSPSDPESVGTRLAEMLLAGGADAILKSIRESIPGPA